jgi:hypothetical protein
MSSVAPSVSPRQPLPTLHGLRIRLQRCRPKDRLETLGTLWIAVSEHPDLFPDEREAMLAYLRQESSNESVPDEPRWRGNREHSDQRREPAAAPFRRCWCLDALTRLFVLSHVAHRNPDLRVAYKSAYGAKRLVLPKQWRKRKAG